MLLAVTSQCQDKTLIQVLKQFSPRATRMVIILLICAAIMGWYQLGTVGALFTSDYGRWLMLKIGLVTVTLILAVLNRWRYTPALEAMRPHARSRLHSAIRLETAIMVIVIAVTTILASTPPPEKTAAQATLSANSAADTSLTIQALITPPEPALITLE